MRADEVSAVTTEWSTPQLPTLRALSTTQDTPVPEITSRLSVIDHHCTRARRPSDSRILNSTCGSPDARCASCDRAAGARCWPQASARCSTTPNGSQRVVNRAPVLPRRVRSQAGRPDGCAHHDAAGRTMILFTARVKSGQLHTFITRFPLMIHPF